MSHVGALSTPKRYITAHGANGESIFHTGVSEPVVMYGESIKNASKKAAGAEMSPTASSSSCIAYTTSKPPILLADNVDIEAYSVHQSANATLPLPFTFPGGTTTHYSEIGPGLVTPMHRTVSIDQIVVLQGTLELILDSGEKRVLERGDMVVQRGTMHAWRNPSETDWVRFFAVVQPIEQIEIHGQKLDIEYRSMPDV
jgi:mannose-6-phosphate isomerase-like protein (cupin superfamily)